MTRTPMTGTPITAASTDTRALDDIRRVVEAAENKGEAEAIAALFAEDAVLMVPDFPVQEGRTACAAFLQDLLPGLLEHFDRRIAYTSAEVRVLGDLAFDRGTFVFAVRPRAGGTTDRVTGKYLWLYSRGVDGWKFSRMIVTRDEQAGEAEPAPTPPAVWRPPPALMWIAGGLLAAAAVVVIARSPMDPPASGDS